MEYIVFIPVYRVGETDSLAAQDYSSNPTPFRLGSLVEASVGLRPVEDLRDADLLLQHEV